MGKKDLQNAEFNAAAIAAKIDLQNAEFNAVDKLCTAWRRLAMTPPVDDDYPEIRYGYETALRDLLSAATANGRAPTVTGPTQN